MANHVIYLRAPFERALQAAGLDPGEWVREYVKREANRIQKILETGGEMPSNPELEDVLDAHFGQKEE